MEAISLIFRRLAGFPNTLKITSPPSLAQPGRVISEALRGMKGTLGAHDHFRVKTFRDFDDLQCPGRDSNLTERTSKNLTSTPSYPACPRFCSARNSVLFRLVPPRGAGSAIRRQRTRARPTLASPIFRSPAKGEVPA